MTIEKRDLDGSMRESDKIMRESDDVDFYPPSVPTTHTTTSTTYLSKVPRVILADKTAPCVLGVDEAGRGPVLGAMVYGVSYCLQDYERQLKSDYGFADSKTLSEERRTQLMAQICDESSELFENIGWATRSLTAADISSGMLKPNAVGNYNLNEQAHDATIDLIQHVLDLGVNLAHVYVDTVGPPVSYQTKLSARFPGVKFTVAKKADAIYPIVSTASICAKVTRDYNLEFYRKRFLGEEPWGCGYPSDPRTTKWLKGKVDPLYGWNSMVRFSWQTSKDALKNGGAAEIVWEEDDSAKAAEALDKMDLSTLWWGSNTVLG
ncbi:hypothetical protein BABINDRAFT_180756 [Babjeviella inositovora NRRL Y-12698]|uniref:Ribonuclease n=1 Tax=Babjeviella inositovora NRRL Y-12698 TaxID=984486 RepID=A0A1E3QPY2_9ASCO|nr:uncharacterized protein BABINDRAFT_180756 [Babjeviella inositovora NRRL Y-12698]ODQ79027.1 hypothetical protein BABINDRAFT_180756 [Babjeviella inositovora NRRL Y-12698]